MCEEQTKKLSPEQAHFVYAPKGTHQSLQSWAGTGKTHTMIERLVHLVTKCGVDPNGIVVTTFTVDGAKECRDRLASRMPVSAASVRVGTLDSLACRWLYSSCEQMDEVYVGVQEYGELLLRFLKTDEGDIIKQSVTYLMVDEFQDLSRVQFDIVMEFCKTGRTTILAIGDIAQNIYEWRGCHGYFMTSLPERIPGLSMSRLTINRRCTPEIIDVGNACLQWLRQPACQLMRPSRPSLGIYPLLDTMGSLNGLGAYVVHLLQMYQRIHGIPFDQMAVIARYRRQLFDVEERLLLARLEHTAPVPFVTSASAAADDGMGGHLGEATPHRREGHATLMSVHQSKGLEWPLVIVILWDAKQIEEEWRLLYVAFTRARDRLHVISQHPDLTTTFLNRLQLETSCTSAHSYFRTPGGYMLEVDRFKMDRPIEDSKTDKRRTSNNVTMFRVADVVSMLTPSDLDEMRRRVLIPNGVKGATRVAPGCQRSRLCLSSKRGITGDSSDESDDDEDEDEVVANGLQVEFANFVDRYITRMLHVATALQHDAQCRDRLLHDRHVDTILGTVFVSRRIWVVYTRFRIVFQQHAAGQLSATQTLEVIGNLVRDAFQCDDPLKSSLQAAQQKERSEILMTARQFMTILSEYRLYSTTVTTTMTLKVVCGRNIMSARERKQLAEAYRAYQDSHVPLRKALIAIYRVSLCAALVQGRKGVWYHSSAFGWFCKRLALVKPCILKFCEKVTTSHAAGAVQALKPNLAYVVDMDQTTIALQSEADLVLCDGTLVTFRCSTRSHDFSWFLHGMIMTAMASHMQFKVQRFKVFNPWLRTVWEFDCSEWTNRTELLDYMLCVASRCSSC